MVWLAVYHVQIPGATVDQEEAPGDPPPPGGGLGGGGGMPSTRKMKYGARKRTDGVVRSGGQWCTLQVEKLDSRACLAGTHPAAFGRRASQGMVHKGLPE